MPGHLTYSGATYPTGSEAGDGPAAFLAFGSDIDQLLVLKATSQANRDSLYSGVSAGTLVSCASLKTVWMKTTTPPTAAAWITLAELGTPVTSGVVTAATGFSVSSQWAQRINGVNWIRVDLSNTGADITGGAETGTAPGNITDTPVATIQSAWLPASGSGTWPADMYGSIVTAAGMVTNSGTVNLTSLVPGGLLRSGDTLRFTVSYPGV
jgi:hypothetical protein